MKNLKIKEVKYLEWDSFIEALEEIFEMPYSSGGAWNAPKNKASFDIIFPSKSDDSHVLQGDARLLWQGYINEPEPLDRVPKFKPSNGNSFHKLVNLCDCFLALQKADLIQIDDFCIVFYSW